MPSTQIDRIDGLTASVAVKAPCATVATAAVTLSGLQTINGATLVDGNRVLVTAQGSSADNGIYVAHSSAWERALDFDGPRDVVNGTLVLIAGGGYAGQVYRAVTTDNPVIIGTSTIGFTVTIISFSGFTSPVGADATGSADSYASFAAAEAALPSTGGILFVPPGLYKINTPINWNHSNTLILAYGARFTSSAAVDSIFDFSAVTLAGIEGASFNYSNNATPTGMVKVDGDSQRCFIRNCEFTGNQSSNSNLKCVNVLNANETQITGNRFSGTNTNLRGIGVSLGTANTPGTEANATWIKENRFGSCDSGLILNNGNSVFSFMNNYERCVNGIFLQADNQNFAYGFITEKDRFELNTKGVYDNRSVDQSNGQCPQLIDPIYTNLGNTALFYNPNNMRWAGRLQNGDAFGVNIGQVANASGSINISDAATSATVTFPAHYPETDATYLVFLTPRQAAGSPASGAYRARVVNQLTTSFDIQLELAPGAGTTVAYNWQIRR